MNKSVIRHILTALGAVLAFLGLGNFTGLLEILSSNLDGVWDAVALLIGVVTSVFGYFKGREETPAHPNK